MDDTMKNHPAYRSKMKLVQEASPEVRDAVKSGTVSLLSAARCLQSDITSLDAIIHYERSRSIPQAQAKQRWGSDAEVIAP